jgi:hypothetical protein
MKYAKKTKNKIQFTPYSHTWSIEVPDFDNVTYHSQ